MQINTIFGIPVFILDKEGIELPTSGNYYVVAGNGTFLHKDNGLIHAIIPVNAVSILEDYKPDNAAIGHNLAKIPADLCYKIKKFFAKVVAEHNSESCVVLFYNSETRKYVLVVPWQVVSKACVYYHRGGLTHLAELAGFVPVGTIHSHCDFDAFHSGTDDHDERYWDGLHITFGHNDKDEFDISASVVMNSNRAMFDPMTIIDGITHVKDDIYTLVEQKHDCEAEINSWMQQILTPEQFKVLEVGDETGN